MQIVHTIQTNGPFMQETAELEVVCVVQVHAACRYALLCIKVDLANHAN